MAESKTVPSERSANGRLFLVGFLVVLLSLLLVSAGVSAFGLVAKYLPVFPEEGEHAT